MCQNVRKLILCAFADNVSELRPKWGVDEDNTDAIFLLRY